MVDDDPAVLQVVVAVLEREGYHVLAASSGKRALEICMEFKGELRLVLTDVSMPEMGGKELADCISDFEDPVPIVLMSGFVREHPLLQGLAKHGRLHSYRFLHKPFVARELAQAVAAAIRKSSSN